MFVSVALAAALLNVLLHPKLSRHPGTLGNTLKRSSRPCTVYILKRLVVSPGPLWKEVKIEIFPGKSHTDCYQPARC